MNLTYYIVAGLCATVVLIWIHIVDEARKSTEMIQLLRSIDEKLDATGPERQLDDSEPHSSRQVGQPSEE